MVLLWATLVALRDSGSILRHAEVHLETVVLLCATLVAFRDSGSILRHAEGH